MIHVESYSASFTDSLRAILIAKTKIFSFKQSLSKIFMQQRYKTMENYYLIDHTQLLESIKNIRNLPKMSINFETKN